MEGYEGPGGMPTAYRDPGPTVTTGNTSPLATPLPDSWSRELVKAIAMDIGKAAVHHLETMYPAAIEACPDTMKLSLRNTIHNEIMSALETTDADEIAERLKRRKAHRREIKAAYRKIRERSA